MFSTYFFLFLLSRTLIVSDFSCVGQFSAKDKSVNFRWKWWPLNKFEQYTVWRGLLQIESLSLTLHEEREREMAKMEERDHYYSSMTNY